MRATLAAALLVCSLYVAAPAHAQRRADLPGQPAPVAVYETAGAPALSSLFNASTLRFSQSYEMSYSSLGSGAGVGLGLYTSSLRWQPSNRLAARVDVGVAHSPFGDDATRQALGFDGNTPARVFLRNAELAYRPTAGSVIHLQVRQSPYGRYASPYGYEYGGYGNRYGPAYGSPFGSEFRATIAPGDDEALFWRDGR